MLNKDPLKESTWKLHLSELRGRLIGISLFFVISIGLGFFLAKPIFQYLTNVYFGEANFNWNVFGPTDVFGIYFKFSLLFAVFTTLPFLYLNVLMYLKSGLYSGELKRVYLYSVGSITLLFVSAYLTIEFIIPRSFLFIDYLNTQMGLTQTYGVNQFSSFLIGILFGIIAVFQLPILVFILSEIGIVSPTLLRKLRKHAYFFMLIASALITPPDFVTNFILWVILIFLYEISTFACNFGYKNYIKKRTKEIQEMTIYE